ncbi:MAG: hypothetical protein V4662_08915 [Verrucomicrobiota bacterium]
MTREEARLELDATTLRPQDASAEARAHVERDADLAAWVQQRTAFDESVAEALVPDAVPEGLRERLLALEHAHLPARTRKPVRWMRRGLMSAAAAVACFWLGWAMIDPVSGEMPPWQAESLRAISRVEHGLAKLDERAPTYEEVRQFLIASGAPCPGKRLPGCLCSQPTFGCKRVKVAGYPATIVCFKLEGRKEAHLIVFDNATFPDVLEKLPKLRTSHNWHLATWSEGAKTYMLATTADEGELKRLLGLV